MSSTPTTEPWPEEKDYPVKVKTTIGQEVEADKAEYATLRAQGLIDFGKKAGN